MQKQTGRQATWMTSQRCLVQKLNLAFINICLPIKQKSGRIHTQTWKRAGNFKHRDFFSFFLYFFLEQTRCSCWVPGERERVQEEVEEGEEVGPFDR